MFRNTSTGYIFNAPSYRNVQSPVDSSDFKPDRENVRALKFSATSAGSPVSLKYDYNDGKVPKNDLVSPAIVRLRSGKYDRAEFDQMKEAILADVRSSNDVRRASEINKAVEKSLGLVGDNVLRETSVK